jgi:hypothetical protein
MMIFKLPNLNGGTVILEKMFRKEKPEYGRATKVLNISFEEFDNIKDDLIVNGDIPVSKIATHPKLIDKVEDFVHSANWGGHVAEYFDYQTDSRRSKENVQKIDNAIKDIIKSRSLRDK